VDATTKRVQAVEQEIEGIKLGDERLNYRARRIAKRIATEPGLGFPQALATEAELEGFYRFVGNDKVTAQAILEPHVRATAQRAEEQGTVLVVHDTTEFRFGGQGRDGLGVVTREGNAFLGHFSLVVSADGKRDPLGVLATKAWVRDGGITPTKALKQNLASYKETRGQPSEQDRWFESVERTEKCIGGRASLIHVMDSEADDYALLWNLQKAKRRFVLRLCYDRRLDEVATGASPGEKTCCFVARSTIRAVREVKLSRRKRAIAGGRTRRVAPREERSATLIFTASTVVVRRPASAVGSIPETLSVNVVAVREKDPPEGVEPVDWYLLTSEPIETRGQILQVVDIYRARWLIEEYFKAIKTGCVFEQRQLETKSTILKALALFTPVAWALLRMRALSRSSERRPIATVLSPTQLAILKKETGIPLRKNSSASDAYLAVARLGGHIKNNGPPGWQVLGRGYAKLLTLQAGYEIAKRETYDQ
jgi:hypothetical protein